MSQPDEQNEPQTSTSGGVYTTGDVSDLGGVNISGGTTGNITYTDS